ncbi:MAG: coaD [Gammaproteobacteria bacterium]|nr:coaD [Gammaproteobacteria bacterium]
MIKIAVYPGTFDPITYGHIELVERAAQLFDRVIVAVAANKNKTPFFSLKERVELTELALKKLNNNVKVLGFDNLLIDFMRSHQATVILRGVRMVSDFEYEFQLAGMNRKLAPEIESLFLMPSQNYTCVASSFVREVALLGGDITPFVPQSVAMAFNHKLRK